MKLLFLVGLVGLVGCYMGPAPEPETSKTRSNYWFDRSQDIGSNFRRLENQEVICYLYDGYREGSLSCKFK